MQNQIIKPQFHYTFKTDSVILDSQYNYQGNLLAVSTSNGQLLFYQSYTQQPNRQPIYIYKQSSAIIKISWSDPNFNLLGACSIQKYITIYKYNRQKGLNQIISIKQNWIPISICFCPIDKQILLTVGFSNGDIKLYNSQFNQISTHQAHQQSVNYLNWQSKISNYFKNQWIVNNFYTKNNTNDQDYPLLLSCSSDLYFKIWKYNKKNQKDKKLIELIKVKAHDKPIRQVQWKPNCFPQQQKKIASCSQDGHVRIWGVTITQPFSISVQKKQQLNFSGPVYKASYNHLGTLIAICYCNQQQQKVQTRIMQDKNGLLVDIQKKYENQKCDK